MDCIAALVPGRRRCAIGSLPTHACHTRRYALAIFSIKSPRWSCSGCDGPSPGSLVNPRPNPDPSPVSVPRTTYSETFRKNDGTSTATRIISPHTVLIPSSNTPIIDFHTVKCFAAIGVKEPPDFFRSSSRCLMIAFASRPKASNRQAFLCVTAGM